MLLSLVVVAFVLRVTFLAGLLLAFCDLAQVRLRLFELKGLLTSTLYAKDLAGF